MTKDLKIFSGNAHRELAREICEFLGIPIGDLTVSRFADGEIRVKINENVRGIDLFIVQPTFAPAENLFELLLIIDAARRASARRITAVIPYFGYARQDRKDQPRVPVSAKLVANLLTVAGTDRVLTMDLHAEPIGGFFDIPVDHLYAAPVMIKYLLKKGVKGYIVVAPDTGGVNRARAFAKRLGGLPLAFIDKRRSGPDLVDEVMYVVGEVKRKNTIIVDDVLDTGRTMVKVAEALKEKGAEEIYASATHPILSGKAIQLIRKSCIKEAIVTNTVPLPEEKKDPKIIVLSVASLLGEAIRRIHEEKSVSSLFV